MEKIVSIHIPKTAGTSFKESLSRHYSNILLEYGYNIGRNIDQLIDDFNQSEKSINIENYNTIDCIHGHILPIKYKKLYDAGWKFITWIRDPAQKLFSQYYHLIRHKDEYEGNKKFNTIGKYIIENNLTVEEFVLSSISRNYYQRFFYDFPIEKYYFIGVVENYETDLMYLSKLLNLELSIELLNINPHKVSKTYNINSDLLEKIKVNHHDDYVLYNKILKNSNDRIK